MREDWESKHVAGFLARSTERSEGVRAKNPREIFKLPSVLSVAKLRLDRPKGGEPKARELKNRGGLDATEGSESQG